MPMTNIPQPHILPVDEFLRLRRFDGEYGFALGWYQDEETTRLVDGAPDRYSPDRLKRMYEYLDAHGELYFIEALEEGFWMPIGDVTFWADDMPIVIGDPDYRGRGVGRKVVAALIQRARSLGFSRLGVGEIYDFNVGSRRCFEACGFRAVEKTEKGHRYELILEGCV